MISRQQLEQYRAQGQPVLPGFKTAPELAALRARAAQIVDAFDADARRSIFSTTDPARQAQRSASGAGFLALKPPGSPSSRRRAWSVRCPTQLAGRSIRVPRPSRRCPP